MADNVVLFIERNFDVGVFSSFCREDLDAEKVVLGGRSRLVVAVDLATELNRGSPRLGGHFEISAIDRFAKEGLQL